MGGGGWGGPGERGGVYLRMDHIDQSFKTNVFEYKLNQYSKRTLGNQKYCAKRGITLAKHAYSHILYKYMCKWMLNCVKFE